MKKVFAVVFCIIFVACAVCSCSKNSIVGRWSDGLVIYEYTEDGQYITDEEYDRAGKYKIEGSKIVYYSEDTEPIAIEYSIKGDTLTIGKGEHPLVLKRMADEENDEER